MGAVHESKKIRFDHAPMFVERDLAETAHRRGSRIVDPYVEFAVAFDRGAGRPGGGLWIRDVARKDEALRAEFAAFGGYVFELIFTTRDKGQARLGGGEAEGGGPSDT